jgi:phage terminase large subunit
MELQLKVTNVFNRNLDAYGSKKRFICNQGGSRSSKTFSILQLLIFICLTNPGKKISIVRKSFPSLRGSILKDFMEIMDYLNLYNIKNHNRTEHIYKFDNGSLIEFFSIDDAKKVRGRRRDIAYLNEANELSFDDFQQLSLRTTECLFLDFNPSDDNHFIYDLLKDERSILIKSTYKDNIFLNKDLIIEIENLINVDENYYRIYALGERPSVTARIYSHFKQYTDEPETDKIFYGADIGWVNKSSIIEVKQVENKFYIKELLYKSGLTTDEFIQEVKSKIDLTKIIYVDSARPDIIEQLKRNKINAKASDKQVKEGIDYIRSKEIFIHYESVNLWNEYRGYMYKTIMGNISEEPIKINDHAIDAMRYAIYTNRSSVNIKRVGFY